MSRLEELTPGVTVSGILPEQAVDVLAVRWFGEAVELTYKQPSGTVDNTLLYRSHEATLQLVEDAAEWQLDADGELFRLVSEAYRLNLAYLFDPLLAVHTSQVEPLPHQISAVYEEMLQRQPLRFLLADDPGAGKTIMAGLLMKELVARGDLRRCLVCCPGSLVEQWQDELWRKFDLPFEIITRDRMEAARSGNPFAELDLAIGRLDHMSRNEDVQAKLQQTDWDLVVVDEAHKMSASFFGGEKRETKRYQLGKTLAGVSRHFLLATATPHNGKEEDFQLFMALLDPDRFEGRYREGVHSADTSDLMRRLTKEQLVRFDGTPLFPERRAYTVNYELSPEESELYEAVTSYVRNEFDRASALEDGGRAGTVGFALTILQRRLASSPEAIAQSLRRRRERLERRLKEEREAKRGAEMRVEPGLPLFDAEDLEDLDEAPGDELEDTEERVVDLATAARTIEELEQELGTLWRLETLAGRVRSSRRDRKWDQLSGLVQEEQEMFDEGGRRRKLIVFTEHRDTLNYLAARLTELIGREEAVVTVSGGMSREARRNAQERFLHDSQTQILVATDAAGEGANLQRANLMINYDLPWNPNRLEQRFGRIHRIGQTEVCHLWNLVAHETREGDVYTKLLTKLEAEREALGGRVFDVLGEVFREQPLRDLLVEAIRNGESANTQEEIDAVLDQALDHEHLRRLLEERGLATDPLDTGAVDRIRTDMERAEALRLQPHFISAFFLEAFALLGGKLYERESGRYEVTHVPAVVRNRAREIAPYDPVLLRYERVAFDKALVGVPDKPPAEFLCPGHPLLDATVSLTLERHRGLLDRGTVLVDETDPGDKIRALVFLEHTVHDHRADANGGRRVASRRLQFVELSGDGQIHDGGYAPYLDYRPASEQELERGRELVAERWETGAVAERALGYAIEHMVPGHLEEVRAAREERVTKSEAAVWDRLTKEITHWDGRAEELKEQERAGRPNARINSALATRRSDELSSRRDHRMAELQRERQVSTAPPVVVGTALVLPAGLVGSDGGEEDPQSQARETKRVELLAMQAVERTERALGYEPCDVSEQKLGYDIESRDPGSGRLRFIEVKGRAAGAPTVTITRNEILTALNKPEDFILAVVEVDGEKAGEPRYVWRPFDREPDTWAASVNYDLKRLLAGGRESS